MVGRFSEKGVSGFSLIEALIAMAIIATAATMILPTFLRQKEVNKFSSAKQLCESIVRSKLQDYKNGRKIGDLSSISSQTGHSDLNLLTATNYSDTTLSGLSDTPDPSPSITAAGGFYYSKIRYNAFYPGSCSLQSNISVYTDHGLPSQTFGMRECIGTDTAWTTTEPTGGCSAQANGGEIDARISSELPGFKLFVKLELQTPWPYTINGTSAQATAYSSTCPNSRAITEPTTGHELYDFEGASDAIKVTVTGVIDTHSVTSGIPSWAVDDPYRLTCTASTIVSQPSSLFRYYLSTTGRIFYKAGLGLNGHATGQEVFASLVESDSQSNIKSIAVHPRNFSIYVLRGNTLVRYGNCSGQPIDCSIDQSSSNGISDNGVGSWQDVQEFDLQDVSIRWIMVDFRNNIIYGATSNLQQVFKISKSDGTSIAVSNDSSNSVAIETSIEEVDSTASPTPFPFPFPSQIDRLTSVFISPEGDSTFISDRTSLTPSGADHYTSTIYRASDDSLLFPMQTFPVDATGFSQ